MEAVLPKGPLLWIMVGDNHPEFKASIEALATKAAGLIIGSGQDPQTMQYTNFGYDRDKIDATLGDIVNSIGGRSTVMVSVQSDLSLIPIATESTTSSISRLPFIKCSASGR